MPNGGLAFYNCGPLSGRSQPHKHVQVVPLPLHESQHNAPPIQVAIDAAQRSSQRPTAAEGSPLPICELRSMPFAAFYVNLPATVQPAELEAAGAALLHRCRQHAGQPEVSYNCLMSSRFLMYVPRGAEGCGTVDCNALGFAGTMLVRSQPELDFIKGMGPTEYLAAVGMPW
jgi:ATP adenylyltransferase